MLYGLTQLQRERFDEQGFLIIDNALSPDQLNKLVDVVDGLYAKYGGRADSGRLEMRNVIEHHPCLRDLISHRLILPLVVDLLGANIKMRSTHLDIRPPLKRESVTNKLGSDRWGEPEQWHVDGPIFGYPLVHDLLPLTEIKVGFYLSDVSNPESGQLCVISGSHKLDYRALAHSSPPDESVFRVAVRPGSAVLFRTGIWHCVSPNLSELTRKVLYYAYTYRWIHPSDYMTQSPELLAACTPIQRQLLGAPLSSVGPLGPEPETRPESFFWFYEPSNLPILEWFNNLAKHPSHS
jgi:ectoine hydroxylase-related dioxygenase (phytanoyl-CoA dioxygenase family)